MSESDRPPLTQRWAHLRFAVIGPLLAAPPARGELRPALQALAERSWTHPGTGQPTQFAVSTLERWYYTARHARQDPVGALRQLPRRDRGQPRGLSVPLRDRLRTQYGAHPSWSYQLHYDNLASQVWADATLGELPSYATVRRFMQAQGLVRQPHGRRAPRPGELRAVAHRQAREVRSYEAAQVHALWHVDGHVGSLPVLTARGTWLRPVLIGALDDRSRLACHVQWYHTESAQTVVHGLCQAFQKRALPRALLSDNGAAMLAAETVQGLQRLGIVHDTTLPYSAYQNGKQEVFWAQVEGRLLAMLEGCRDLTLAQLNEATQVWCEREYNRTPHRELGTTPLARALAGPSVGRDAPDSEALRLAFCAEERRTQRRSDGTISLAGRRFEVPARFGHLPRLTVRFARWDLAQVHLVDDQTGTVLDRLYPVDKTRNADGQRRRRPGPTPEGEPVPAARPRPREVAPRLQRLLAEQAETGLPPSYLPLDDPIPPEDS